MPVEIQSRKVYFIGEEECSELAYKSKTDTPQIYEELIKQYDASNPFVDLEFPTNSESIGAVDVDLLHKENPDWDGTFQWKRVKDLVPFYKICFYASGSRPGDQGKYSRFDVKQGQLGDCWFLSGLAEITTRPQIAEFVIPIDNADNIDSGVFHFRMCHSGIWIDVVVDDWIPYFEPSGPGNGELPLTMAPIKIESPEPRAEIWMTLAEKAYAKLNGNFGNIEGCEPRYGLEELTGGIGYCVQLKSQTLSEEGFHKLERFDHRNNFAIFSTDTLYKMGEILPDGLVAGHAYAMTGTARLSVPGEGTINLIRIRNPWGYSGEWNGDWSDKSSLWDKIPQPEKDRVGYANMDDGEFYITYRDLLKAFCQADYCVTIPLEDVAAGVETKKRNYETHHGSWSVANGTAGGIEQPANNPQYKFTIGGEGGSDCEVVVSLMFKGQLHDANDYPAYGYQIFWVSDPAYVLWKWTDGSGFGQDFFDSPHNVLEKTSQTKKGKQEFSFFWHEVNNVFSLQAGTYVIVPATFDVNIEGDFCLRLWYQTPTQQGDISDVGTTTVDELGDATTKKEKRHTGIQGRISGVTTHLRDGLTAPKRFWQKHT